VSSPRSGAWRELSGSAIESTRSKDYLLWQHASAPMNKAALRKELMELTPAERIELAMDLWDSLETQDLPPLSVEQIKAIDEEIAAHEKYPTATVPWDVLRAELRSRPK
jgi:putative addiction module component (TIGR02574 family)